MMRSAIVLTLLFASRASGCEVCGNGDPHLTLAHGGHADFRGRDGAVYSLVSSPGFALNARTRDATFDLGAARIHGSFFTEVFVVAQTSADAAKLTLTYDANRLNDQNWAPDMVFGRCGDETFLLSKHSHRYCGKTLLTIDFSTLTIDAADWTVRVSGNFVYRPVEGPRHRLDLSLSIRADERVLRPHGLLGQSYDGDKLPRFGAVDVYPPKGVYRTRAMAEGAIDGNASQYELDGPHAVAFFASRFGGGGAAASSRSEGRGPYLPSAAQEAEHDRRRLAERARRLSDAGCCGPQGELTSAQATTSVSFRTVIWLKGTTAGPHVSFNGNHMTGAIAQELLNNHTGPSTSYGSDPAQHYTLGRSMKKLAGNLALGGRLFSYNGAAWGGQAGLADEQNVLTKPGETAYFVRTDSDGYIVDIALVAVPTS